MNYREYTANGVSKGNLLSGLRKPTSKSLSKTKICHAMDNLSALRCTMAILRRIRMVNGRTSDTKGEGGGFKGRLLAAYYQSLKDKERLLGYK